MNSEAFWIRLENEVVPHVERSQPEYSRLFREILEKLRNVDISQNPKITQHQWLNLGCILRDMHCYEGLDIRTLVEHCSEAGGLKPKTITIFND